MTTLNRTHRDRDLYRCSVCEVLIEAPAGLDCVRCPRCCALAEAHVSKWAVAFEWAPAILLAAVLGSWVAYELWKVARGG